ncbi:MAG TPA: septation regulator SpoVG [Myxococcota bacterium]|nr:septation regulator SpoVG [Myxococcota bacterium]
MEITEVRVFPVNEEKLKAYATITFDRCFVVRDLKVIQGNNGLFVAMPSKKRKDGTFKDTAHPLNTETREKIEAAVLQEYRGELERTGAPPPDVGDRKLDSSAVGEGDAVPDSSPDQGDGTDTQGE